MYQFHNISIWSQWTISSQTFSPLDHWVISHGGIFNLTSTIGSRLIWQEVSFKSWQFLFFVIVGFMYSSFRLGWFEMMIALDQYLWQCLKSRGHSNRSTWASLYYPKITQTTIPPFVILCSCSKPIQTSSCSQLVLLLALGQKVAYSSQSVPNVSAR